jgi:hypothetical protein
MAYAYTITEDNKCEILKDKVKVDTVGPWDSAEGAQLWGEAVCAKYNSAEYAGVNYPNDLPKEEN